MPGKSLHFSRRAFLAGSAALMARRAVGAPAAGGDFEVVIVGAGAAGIAAARRLAAAGRRYVVIEATDHVGGRCVTDTKTFGVPFDRGAHWIYLPDSNPVTKLTPRNGIDIYPAPESQKVRIGLRYAREGELEDFLSAQVRTTRAISDAARKADVACEQAVPNDLGDWRGAVEFVLGPYACAKNLVQVSSLDFARAAERNKAAFCKQGFGAMLAALARGLNIHLATPATAVDSRGTITVQTGKGTIAARTAIVTVPTNVIASGGLRFGSDFGHQAIDAFGRVSLGSYDHIALELAGNPLGLDSDDLVFEKSADTHTAAILANVSGTELCLIDVAGAFGRELSAQGEAAMIDFAGNWLARLYGSEVKNAIGRKYATRWNSEPFALGAWSAAGPGGQSARRQLLQPIADDVWYAGEAAHETLWGTVGGAWESGERAADAVLRRLGPLRSAAPAEPEAKAKRKPSVRARVERRERRESLEPRYYGGTPNIMAPER
ncbi:MAG TPA: FAD-dependent oxidoreductase [Xanthobacteraceae bacterium]|nr:FAD-dependent oxidoreductase [Xanthobacteraceae bacterium]